MLDDAVCLGYGGWARWIKFKSENSGMIDFVSILTAALLCVPCVTD